MPTAAPAPLTPRDIIVEIGRNLEASCIPLMYRVLVPSVYEIFLHPDDHHRLELTFAAIREDAAHHLTKQLEKLNKPPRLKLPGQKQLPHQRDGNDWQIDFKLADPAEVAKGGLVISSQLRVPSSGAGSHTQRTVTARFEDGARTERGDAPTGPVASSPVASSTTSAAFAHIVIDGAQHAMDREEISIGRGGDGRWVDIPIPHQKAVSKEHLLLRYSGQRFEAKDTSTNGTKLNGQPMARDTWTPVGATAQFELAKGVVLDFRALR